MSTRPRTLSLHIDRIVIHDIAGLDSTRLQSSVQGELTRLLSARELPAGLDSKPRLEAPGIDGRGDSSRIGERVARATWRALGGSL